MKALLAILMILVVVTLAITLWVNVADAAPFASLDAAVSSAVDVGPVYGPLQLLSRA